MLAECHPFMIFFSFSGIPRCLKNTEAEASQQYCFWTNIQVLEVNCKQMHYHSAIIMSCFTMSCVFPSHERRRTFRQYSISLIVWPGGKNSCYTMLLKLKKTVNKLDKLFFDSSGSIHWDDWVLVLMSHPYTHVSSPLWPIWTVLNHWWLHSATPEQCLIDTAFGRNSTISINECKIVLPHVSYPKHLKNYLAWAKW